MRGLKHNLGLEHYFYSKSHPTWVRGLKRTDDYYMVSKLYVAPYVGAWIETYNPSSVKNHVSVAPYVGAWIETKELVFKNPAHGVAPYVGAWIET